MKKVLLFGDSNTYGYDPRGMLGNRYPYEIVWSNLLKKELKGQYDIIEEGQNGRTLPSIPRDMEYLKNLTGMLGEDDTFVIMLGTNDILLTANPRPEAAVDKMNDLLLWAKSELSKVKIIVIAPVNIENQSGDMKEYYEASVKMNEGFEKVCEELGITFWDASKWNVPMAYDGVHIAEEGQKVFVEHFFELYELGVEK